jgi:hypothetical protein
MQRRGRSRKTKTPPAAPSFLRSHGSLITLSKAHTLAAHSPALSACTPPPTLVIHHHRARGAKMEGEFDHQRVDELLHRMQLFERGLSAVIQSLDAPPAQLAAAHAFNEHALAERAAQERARSAHHTRVLQRQLRARARLVVELLRVRRAQVQARIAHRQQVLQVRGPTRNKQIFFA